MSKKRLKPAAPHKPEDLKTMIARSAAVKIVPVMRRMDDFEETLKEMQTMLKAIQARLSIVPDDPALETANAGLDGDPMAAVERSPLARRLNPLLFRENRRAVEKVFAKRGWKEGDTVDSVLSEARSLN